ncbi:sulfotransferase 6B1-like [Discoglossus pictus]
MANREKFVEEIEKLFEAAKDLSPDDLLFTYKGVLYPTSVCSPEEFQSLESFETRADDILLAVYPKCGTNWTLSVIQDMIHAVYNQDAPAVIPMIEFKWKDKSEKLKQAPSPRVLATHFNYDYIPKSIFDKKSKILVVLRNPKDAAVSFFHFYNNDPLLPNYSSWDTFFQDFISGNVVWGSYFDHAVAWNKHIDDEGVFIITFEQMKKDLEGAVKRIADFFGLPLNQEQIHQIADKGTFKSMKKKSKETHGQFGEFLFRKGEVGDWKNYFTKAQSEEVDAKFKEYLAGTKAGELMNYNVYCKF